MRLKPVLYHLRSKIKNLRSYRKRRIAVLAFITVMLGGFAFSTFVLRKDAKADWWDDGWVYRKRVAVDNTTGSNQTDLQVAFTMDATALITAGKMQTDCDDVRVTDKDGNILPHWIEADSSNCNTASTKVWTKLASIPSSDTYIYVYYGNPTVANAKDPDKVFEFFDDFEQNNLDRWTNSSTGSSGAIQRITTTQAYDGTYAAESYQTSDSGDTVIAKTLGSSGARILEYRFYDSGAVSGIMSVNTIGNMNSGVENSTSTTNYSYRCGAGWTATAASRSTGWHKFTLVFSGAQGQWYIDGTLAATAGSCPTTSSVAFGTYWTANSGFYVDQVFSRKYVSADPALSLGSEEKGPAPLIYYSFDEGNDNTCTGGTNDVCNRGSGGNLDAAQSNMTTPSATSGWQTEDQCMSGKCLRFDATDDVIAASSSETDTDDLGAMTLSAWIRADSLGEGGDLGRIFDKSTALGPTNGWIFYLGSNNTLNFGVDFSSVDLGRGTTDNAITFGRWHYVVLTWDGTASSSNAHIYVDGNDVSNTGPDGSGTRNSDAAAALRIGNESGGTKTFDGTIDEVKVYNFVKTADQIKAEFNARGAVKGISARFGDDNKFLSDGLVGYWKMDETALNGCSGGQDSCDSSGNGFHGTWDTGMTSADIVPGKYGNAVDMDGTGDYIDVAYNTALNTNQTMTVSIWIKTTSTALDHIVTRMGTTPYPGYALTLAPNYDCGSAGQVGFWVGDATNRYICSTSTVNDGNWHLITGTYDGSTARLFIDGALAASGVRTNGLDDTSTSLKIGAHSTVRYTGQVDGLRIYNRALSPAEVTKLYNWAPGPVGYWKLDEGIGSTAFDSSGNGNGGTITNASWGPGKFGNSLRTPTSNTREYVTVSDPSSGILDFGTSHSFSINAWGKTTDMTEDPAVISKLVDRSGNNPGYYLFYSEAGGCNGFAVEVYDGTNNDTASDCPGGSGYADGEWHYFSAVFDRTGITFGTAGLYLFADGVLIDTDTSLVTTGSLANSEPMFMGELNVADELINGAIDDVKIYNYARTQAQITEDMNAGHPVPGSPVGSALGHYKFDEGYGDSTNNSGNGGSTLNGNLAGSNSCPGHSYCPSWINDGKFGKALDYDGTDDYLEVAHNSALSLSDFTLSAWVYANTTGENIVIDKRGAASTGGYNLRIQGSSFPKDAVLSVKDTAGEDYLYAYGYVPQNTWTHIVGTFDNTSNVTRIYINGNLVEEGSTTKNPAITPNSNVLRIGDISAYGAAVPSVYNFDGSIDEVKIYSSAMTADQVKMDYNQGKSTVFGATSTDASNNPSWSATNEYCPPGQGSICTPPVAEWKFDESSGTNAEDTSGNGNTGTLTSDPTYVPNIRNSSWTLDFDGSNDSVERVFQPVSAFPFTLQAWIKTSTIEANDRIIWIGDKDVSGASEVQYAIGMNGSGIIRHYAYDGTSNDAADGTSVLTDGEWHMVTVVFESNTSRKIYTDAVLENTATTSITFNSAVDKMCVGKACDSTPGQNIKGLIDDIRVYNYARNPAQIAWEYNQGGPIGWWKFDECSGTTANDSSGNGNNGTITANTGNSVGTCGGTAGDMWADGASGRRNASLAFDGTNDYVQVANSGSLDFGTNADFSVSLWGKTSACDTDASKFIDSRGATAYIVMHCYSDGHMTFNIRDTNSIWGLATSTTNIQDNQWHHILGVKSGNNTYIYVDGKLEGTDSDSFTGSFDVGFYDFGARSTSLGTREVDGQIDEVKIFNYALTAKQAQTLHNEGVVKFGN